MRILRDGKKGKPVFVGKCFTCGCIFEEDKENLSVDHCPREGYAFAHVKCPCCEIRAVMYEHGGKYAPHVPVSLEA